MPVIGHVHAVDCNAPAPEQAPEAPVGVKAAPQIVEGCSALKGTPFENGFPAPGSKEFCEQAVDIENVLSTIGHGLISAATFYDPGVQVYNLLSLTLDKVPGGSIGKTVAALWNLLLKHLADGLSAAYDLVRKIGLQLLDLSRCVTKRCGSAAPEGVWALKAAISLAENADLGIDFGVKATLIMAVPFDLFRSWLDELERFFCPLEVPTAEQATEAWLQDLISDEQRNCIWRLNGHNPDTFSVYAQTQREKLDWRDGIQYVRRIKGGDAAENAILRDRGFVDQQDVDMAREMYWELPGIADHLHWLQRQVFDADYVDKYKLLEGFDNKFWPTFGDDLQALGMREQYAKLHYAAHWIMPSPEQMKEFLYRNDQIIAAGGQPFTLDDYERLLAEQDYNVVARKWFRATAYNVPAISYVKAWFQQDIITKKELQNYHAMLGYDPREAGRFADVDELQKARTRAAASGGWTTKAASSAWANGQIDVQTHDQTFDRLGYTAREAQDARDVASNALQVRVITRARSRVLSSVVKSVTDALDVGVMTSDAASQALQGAGWPQSMADSIVGSLDAIGGLKMLKEVVRYLKSAVIDGTIAFGDARSQLTRLGFTQQATDRYLALWQMQLTPRRKHRSADKVVSDLANGYITTPEALVRLSNLGYDDADSRLYLADAQAKVVKVQQQRLAAQQKKGLARQKAQATAAKAAQKAHDDVVKSMKREAPVATLKKWASLGILGWDLFSQRMLLYGYSPIDTERYWEEACKAKSAACVTRTPAPQNPVANGGSGGTAAGGSAKGG